MSAPIATPTSSSSEVSPALNVERIVADHVPPRIAELENECDALLVKLRDRMAELNRLRLHHSISQL